MWLKRQTRWRSHSAVCTQLNLLGAVFAAVALTLLFGSTALAQDRSKLEAEMDAEFDARPLSAAEKRVLQVGLTLEGAYVGLLDGRWGAGSQSGVEALAVRTDPRARADGLV